MGHLTLIKHVLLIQNSRRVRCGLRRRRRRRLGAQQRAGSQQKHLYCNSRRPHRAALVEPLQAGDSLVPQTLRTRERAAATCRTRQRLRSTAHTSTSSMTACPRSLQPPRTLQQAPTTSNRGREPVQDTICSQRRRRREPHLGRPEHSYFGTQRSQAQPSPQCAAIADTTRRRQRELRVAHTRKGQQAAATSGSRTSKKLEKHWPQLE
jgi:hypothetical protein